MTLIRGSRTIEIMHLGHGDTAGDLVVFLPEDKVACSGDILVHRFPYAFSSKPLEWIETLGKLKALDFDFIVPGHGEVQKGKEYISDVIDVLQSVHTQVKAGVQNGSTLEDIRRTVDVSAFRNKYVGDNLPALYQFGEWFLRPAVDQAYKTYVAIK